MTIGEDLLDQITRVHANSNMRPKTQDPMLGLVEEVGEVATALNVTRHGKGKTLTESAKQECVDVILSALELFFDEGGTVPYLVEYMSIKQRKWERRLDEKRVV